MFKFHLSCGFMAFGEWFFFGHGFQLMADRKIFRKIKVVPKDRNGETSHKCI